MQPVHCRRMRYACIYPTRVKSLKSDMNSRRRRLQGTFLHHHFLVEKSEIDTNAQTKFITNTQAMQTPIGTHQYPSLVRSNRLFFPASFINSLHTVNFKMTCFGQNRPIWSKNASSLLVRIVTNTPQNHIPPDTRQ